MTGTETRKQPAAGTDRRIEAAARALANEAAPESQREHWGTQTEWIKDIYRRRAALALAAADAVERGPESAADDHQIPAVTAGPAAEHPAETLFPWPSLRPDTKTIPEHLRSRLAVRLNTSGAAGRYPHEGDCGGTRCEYCSCCVHSVGTLGCLTSTAPAGMACPDSGCGCVGTGS